MIMRILSIEWKTHQNLLTNITQKKQKKLILLQRKKLKKKKKVQDSN